MKGRSESSTHDYGTLSSVHMHTHSSHPPGLRNPQRQLFSTQQLGALSLLSPSVSLVNTTALGRESFSKNKHRIVSSETCIAHDLAHLRNRCHQARQRGRPAQFAFPQLPKLLTGVMDVIIGWSGGWLLC